MLGGNLGSLLYGDVSVMEKLNHHFCLRTLNIICKKYELSYDSVARLQMTGIPDLGIRVDIMGRVLDPLLCVFLADIQSVRIGACMHVCVWYTELTCISNGVSKTDIVVGKVQCVCVDRWRGHSRSRRP